MTNKMTRLPVFILCVFFLAMTLSSCSLGAAAKPTLKTFEGQGFTVNYPDNWKVDQSGAQVAFSNEEGNAFFVQVVQDVSALQLDDAVKGGIKGFRDQAKNAKDKNIPATKKVNAIEWKQGAVTGDVTENGVTKNSTSVIMAAKDPKKDTTTAVVVYISETSQYDMLEKDVFSPMIESFKFK